MTILQAFVSPLLAIALLSPPSFDQSSVYSGIPVSKPATASIWGPQTAGLSLALVIPTSISVGQPVPVSLELRNDHASNVAIERISDNLLRWVIRNEQGSNLATTRDYGDFPALGGGPMGGDVIEPGKVALTTLRLDHVTTFAQPGRATPREKR